MFSPITRVSAMTAFLMCVLSNAASAQSAPVPSPSPSASATLTSSTKPHAAGAPAGITIPGLPGLSISGLIRAYDFDRLNNPKFIGPTLKPAPNREAFNFLTNIRADYRIGTTPFTIGGAFWGADPLGANGGSINCDGGSTVIPIGLCPKRSGGIDNTLPGFPLETFEYYVKYSDKTANISIGNQILNKTWAGASDSRVKPALYQAADANVNVGKYFQVGLTRITRFESRTDSLFSDCTLLTCTPAGASGLKTVPTTGTDRIAITWKPSNRFTATAENYAYFNIANLTYVEAKYNAAPRTTFNPTIAAQFVGESAAGQKVIGLIDNQTTGVQLGFTPVRNVVFTLGADYAPWNYVNVRAATAAAALAAATNGRAASATLNAVPSYFLPSLSTTQLVAPGLYRIAYGGIASPYSDSYATDPLYTTSLTAGVVDRRSAGFSYKAALAYVSPNKRLTLSASEAAYNQDVLAVRNRLYELDGDATYDFNAVRPGPYKGFLIRERFGDRTQPSLPTQPGNFKYIRHMLQYSF